MPTKGYPRKIIFDMDGVITSEECYWDTAALVVWELLFSERGLGLPPLSGLPPFTAAPDAARVRAIRRAIFVRDRVITFFKKRFVNSNWDLAFYTFAFHYVSLLSRGQAPFRPARDNRLSLPAAASVADLDFKAILDENWAGEATGADLGKKLYALLPPSFSAALPPGIFLPFSPLWEKVRLVFQEWYFGEKGYRELYGQDPEVRGKGGFINAEKPLLPEEKVKNALAQLRKRGWILGAATGRPRLELIPPLERMGLLPYFDPDSMVTFDLVEEAQQALAAQGEALSLGKPHPFSLLRAYWGKDGAGRGLYHAPFPAPPGGCCWMVGDAPADLLTARAAGASFIAVLTGTKGAAGRALFAGMGADAILPDVTHIPSFMGGRPLTCI